jgi:hypothetical protein
MVSLVLKTAMAGSLRNDETSSLLRRARHPFLFLIFSQLSHAVLVQDEAPILIFLVFLSYH